MPIHAAVIQKLLSTNAHIGRRITSHHLKPYIHGNRNSLSVIDSDKTLISLRTALDFISRLSSNRRTARFLFVNTNPLYDNIFDHMTRLTGHNSFLSPQSQYWRGPGFLTNPHSPKKFRGRNKRLCFAPVDPPDCIVLVDVDMKCSVINEAARVGVPVVAIVDSQTSLDVMKKIAYPIVVGSDSVQFVYMFCNLITKTFLLHNKSSFVEPAVGNDDIVNAIADASGSGSGGVGDCDDVLNASGSGSSVVNANGDASGSGDDGDVADLNVAGLFVTTPAMAP